MEDSPSFGQRIQQARHARGMKLGFLARQIGIHPNSLSAIERGKVQPMAVRIRDIALALNVRGEFLLGLSDEMDLWSPTEEDSRHDAALLSGNVVLGERVCLPV